MTGSSPTGTVQFLDRGMVMAQASVAGGVASVTVKLKGGTGAYGRLFGRCQQCREQLRGGGAVRDISSNMAPIYRLLLD